MLYLLKGHKTQNTNRNTTDIKRFFSRLYFFTLSQKTKVVFFNFSRNFRGDARPGPHLSPFRTQSNNSGYSFYVFIKGFRRYGTSLHSPFFCLNCTTVPLYYILRIKLWYCFKSLFFIYRSTKFSILQCVCMVLSDSVPIKMICNYSKSESEIRRIVSCASQGVWNGVLVLNIMGIKHTKCHCRLYIK